MSKALAFLKALPIKDYLIGAAVVAVVGGFAGFVAYERGVGASNAVAAESGHRADSLAGVLDTARTRLRVDTVRTLRSIHTVDTLLQHRIDTAVVQRTDTVKITVREATAIQDTIKACAVTIAECGKVATMERQRADALVQQNTALKKLLPSTAGTWTTRLIAFGAGLVVGHFVK